MQIYTTKPVEVPILCCGERLKLSFRPLTYARIIEITTLCEKEFDKIMSDPTPLDIAKVSYCLLTEESKKLLDSIKLEINDKATEIANAGKLYYLLTEQNIYEGQTNLTSVLSGINEVARQSLPDASKKKANKILNRILNPSILKRFTTSSQANIQHIHTNAL